MSSEYVLTAEEMYQLDKRIHFDYERAVRHREIIPVVEKGGFSSFEHKWHHIPPPGVPQETRELGKVKREIARIKQESENIVFYSFDAIFPWTTLQVSRAGGMDIQDISMQAFTRQLARQEAAFVFRGSTRPAISGLFNQAGNTSTETTAKWGTAPGASTIVQTMVDEQLTDEWDPPYELVISNALAGDMNNFINAAPVTDIRERHSIAGLLGQEKNYFPQVYTALPAAPDKKKVYVLPTPTSNDGVALLFNPGPENFELIVEQPLTTVFGEFDIKERGWPVLIFMALSLRVWEPNSLCKHVTVDLAT